MDPEANAMANAMAGGDSRRGEFAWLALAVLALVFAGIFSIVSALARTPALHSLVPPEFFPRALCTHVFFAMITWIVAFTLFLWNGQIPNLPQKPWLDNLTVLLAFGSVIFIASVGFSGLGEPFANDYVPIIHHPLFWAGFVMMMLALLLGVVKLLPVLPRLLRSVEGQLLALSAIFALFMVTTTALSFAMIPQDPVMKVYFQRVFWVPGHIQQFLNASVMLFGWHYLARRSRSADENAANEAEGGSIWLTLANVVLLLPVLPIAAGVFTDPLSPSFKFVTTTAYGVGLGVPVLIHTVYLARHLRPREFPSAVALCAMGLYYLGVVIAFLGMQSDLRITAHYHGVVSALTVTLMGIAYLQLQDRDVLSFKKLARAQPFIYTAGMMMLIIGLFLAGKLGAPRKTFGAEWSPSDTVLRYLNLMGMGAGLAALGGMAFVLYATRSLWQGARSGSIRFLPRAAAGAAKILSLIALALSLSSFAPPNEELFAGKQIANIAVFDAAGKRWELQELLGAKPIIVIPVYTSCPHSCSIVTEGWHKAVKEIDAKGSRAENDFFVLTFSFDPNDTPEDLRAFAARWGFDGARWRVVSSDSASIRAFLASIDFQTDRDSSTGDYAHPNLGVALTPSGKISGYIHGVSPSPDDIVTAVAEARAERSAVVGFFKGLWAQCFPFNAKTRSYDINWGFIFELAAGVTIIGALLGSLIWSSISAARLKRKERKANASLAASAQNDAANLSTNIAAQV